MIFRTFQRVSYGLVMDAVKPVHIGDFLWDPDSHAVTRRRTASAATISYAARWQHRAALVSASLDSRSMDIESNRAEIEAWLILLRAPGHRRGRDCAN